MNIHSYEHLLDQQLIILTDSPSPPPAPPLPSVRIDLLSLRVSAWFNLGKASLVRMLLHCHVCFRSQHIRRRTMPDRPVINGVVRSLVHGRSCQLDAGVTLGTMCMFPSSWSSSKGFNILQPLLRSSVSSSDPAGVLLWSRPFPHPLRFVYSSFWKARVNA